MAAELASAAELAAVLDALPLLVREKRRRLGLSIREAADDAGVHFSLLYRVERGDDARMSGVRALLHWVGQPDGS